MQNNLQIMADSQTASLPASFSKPASRNHGRPLANELGNILMPHPENSYLFRIHGHTWADQGILDGDIAIVDRKRQPDTSDLVITWHDNGFSISRHWQLLPEDEALGVITSVVHPYK